MATKRPNTEVVGFIHQISPKKGKLFHLKLQTSESTVKKAICFDVAKYGHLKTKHQAREAVKFRNCVVEQKKNKNFSEIVITKTTTLTEPIPSELFTKIEPVLIITNISDLEINKHEMVSVAGKLTTDYRVRKEVNVYGKPTPLTDKNYLSDSTGTIPLTLWDEWIGYFDEQVADGNHYFKIHNLILKSFDPIGKYLTTCSETFVEVSSRIEDIIVDIPLQAPVEELKNITSITAVGKFLYSYICPCNKFIPFVHSATSLRCPSCSFTKRVDKYAKSCQIEIQAENLEGSYLLPYEDITATWPHIQYGPFEIDESVVVEHLLSVTNIDVHVDHTKKVMSIVLD